METYHELRTLSILLRNLLRLDGCCIITAEGQLCDGHIIQNDIEVPRPLSQYPPDVAADHLQHANPSEFGMICCGAADVLMCSHLPHGQQLAGIVLSDDALQALLWHESSRRWHNSHEQHANAYYVLAYDLNIRPG